MEWWLHTPNLAQFPSYNYQIEFLRRSYIFNTLLLVDTSFYMWTFKFKGFIEIYFWKVIFKELSLKGYILIFYIKM